MIYSILTNNIISESIVSGICSINRNIKHYTVPYIKKNIIPEVYEIKLMILQIANTIINNQHITIY